MVERKSVFYLHHNVHEGRAVQESIAFNSGAVEKIVIAEDKARLIAR